MPKTAIASDVLTLKEAAEYLRLSERTVERLVARQGLPCRQVGKQWRFFKPAIQVWLSRRNGRDLLLQQFGALADDPMLSDVVSAIYADRGRPEIETG